jgi:hypothetical protein
MPLEMYADVGKHLVVDLYLTSDFVRLKRICSVFGRTL